MSDSEKAKRIDDYKIAVEQPAITSKVPSPEDLEKLTPYRDLYPVFCFLHFDPDDKDFDIKKIQKAKAFWQLIGKLKHLSKMTWGEIEKGEHHAHDVPWNKSCKNGFPSVCGEFPAYQFGGTGKFRVVGFHNQGIFYIVWLDPDHKFWPMH